MSRRNQDITSEGGGQGIRQSRYILALILVGASLVLIVGSSLKETWIDQVAASDHDGGSTIHIPPPDRPTPQVTDNAPPETATPTSGPIAPTPTEVATQTSGTGTSVTLWFGIGLGAVSLIGLAIGAFILVSSRGFGSDT